jgi:hypothetical protein
VETVQDHERLVAALRARGVDYLAPRDAAGAPMGDEALLASLAGHADPRLRQALCALFLVQPGLAPLVPALARALPREAAVELMAQYMAAVYLREIWATRLARYLPALVPLPDHFSRELRLPPPSAEYGESGLRALAAWHQAAQQQPGNRLAEYENVAELLFGRLQLRVRRDVAAIAGRPG